MFSASHDFASAFRGGGGPEFGAIFARSPDVHLLVAGESGVIIAVDGAVERLLGQAPSTLLGMAAEELLAEESEPGDLPEAHDAVLVLPVKGANGTIQDMDVTLTVVPWTGVPTLLVSLRDRRQQDQQLQARETESQRVSQEERLRSVGTLAAGIAHDFNNLLTHIFCHTGIARDELPPEATAAAGCLDQIDSSSERAADLCRQLLAYAGEGQIGMSPLDLKDLFAAAEPQWRRSLPGGVALHVAPPRQSIMVHADAAQIRLGLGNLLQNAVEAFGGQPGEVRISMFVADAAVEETADTSVVGKVQTKRCICLEVADNGCGMTAETRRRSFDPFFSTKFLGRGLGLAAVWGITRRHGGALLVESRPDEGTRVRLCLPYEGQEIDATEDKGAANTALAVLLIDPNEADRTHTARLLRALGLPVLAVEDLRRAVSVWRAQAEHLGAILLDVSALHGDPTALRQWVTLRATAPILCTLPPKVGTEMILPMVKPAALLRKPLILGELQNALWLHAPRLSSGSEAQ